DRPGRAVWRYRGGMQARRLQTSESLVAGISAVLLATAVFGFAYLVAPSIPFPSLGLAQRLLRLVPGPVAVFFIDHLGPWALRSFAVGFTIGGIAVGGLAGVLVGRQAAARRGRAAWGARLLTGPAPARPPIPVAVRRARRCRGGRLRHHPAGRARPA